MMKKQLLHSVIVGVLAAVSASISIPSLAGTSSLDLTVDANITSGTCSVSVLDGDTATNTIAFGSVYLSEVAAAIKVKAFALRFSDCAGIPNKKAKLVIAPNNVQCPGTNHTNGQFPNASTATDKAVGTNVELWPTSVPETSGTVKFHCWSKNPQEIDLTGASTTAPVDYPLSARLVAESGLSAASRTAGDFYSPTIFTITYP